MMINKFLFFALLLLSCFVQGQKKIIQDFNLDKIKDTLYYNCDKITETVGQPFCRIEINTGKYRKTYKFKLFYVNFPIIDTCGEGCFSLYDDSGDTEYTKEFNYSKKYDDWILTVDEELLKYENNKIVNALSKKNLIGISGKKYPILIKRH